MEISLKLLVIVLSVSSCLSVVVIKNQNRIKNGTQELWDYPDITEQDQQTNSPNGATDAADSTTKMTTKKPPVTKPVEKKPVFTAFGRRVSQAKCYEYIWDMRQRSATTRIERTNYFRLVKGKTKYGIEHARAGEFPHMAAIGWNLISGGIGYYCGGSLISTKFVLTAGHCTKAPDSIKNVTDPSPKVVRLGDNNLENKEPIPGFEALMINIQRLIPHESFKPPLLYNDIALIELEQPATISFLVNPACLWEFAQVKTFTPNATVTGWGITDAIQLTRSDALQAAVVDVFDNPDCDLYLKNRWTTYWFGMHADQMCAGKLNGEVDTCQGDSGGPLQTKIPMPKAYKLSMHYIIGVTSFGIGCGQRNTPAVYTRVATFMDWIEKHVWG